MIFTNISLLSVTESSLCLQSIEVSCHTLYLDEGLPDADYNNLSLKPFAELPKLAHLQVTLHAAVRHSYLGWSVRLPLQGNSL